MKKALIVIIIIILVLSVIAVVNTVQFYSIGKDITKTVASSKAPSYTPVEISNLYKKDVYTAEAEDISVEKIISVNSSWEVEFADLTMLREELHFKIYDFVKSKNFNKADSIIKKYFEIKAYEIEEISEIENEFKENVQFALDESDGIKDEKYFRKFRILIKDKRNNVRKVTENSRTQKINLFGKYYTQLDGIANKFQSNFDESLARDYNLSVEEIKLVREKSIKDGDKLIYLSL